MIAELGVKGGHPVDVVGGKTKELGYSVNRFFAQVSLRVLDFLKNGDQLTAGTFMGGKYGLDPERILNNGHNYTSL
jgi:hypothetical protein